MMYRPQVHYDGTNRYENLDEYSARGTTNASGNIVLYLTDNGLAGGNALFTDVLLNTVTVTPVSTSTIYLNGDPTISADKKILTIPVRQNTSLLGLGLIPFSTAAAGAIGLVRCKAVAL